MAVLPYQIRFAGVLSPAIPKALKIGYSDLDLDSGRSVNTGVLIRQRVRADVTKLEVAFPPLPLATVNTILTLISPSTFSVEYYDVKTSTSKTKTMYAGDRNMETIATGTGLMYELSFNLIEV